MTFIGLFMLVSVAVLMGVCLPRAPRTWNAGGDRGPNPFKGRPLDPAGSRPKMLSDRSQPRWGNPLGAVSTPNQLASNVPPVQDAAQFEKPKPELRRHAEKLWRSRVKDQMACWRSPN